MTIPRSLAESRVLLLEMLLLAWESRAPCVSPRSRSISCRLTSQVWIVRFEAVVRLLLLTIRFMLLCPWVWLRLG